MIATVGIHGRLDLRVTAIPPHCSSHLTHMGTAVALYLSAALFWLTWPLLLQAQSWFSTCYLSLLASSAVAQCWLGTGHCCTRGVQGLAQHYTALHCTARTITVGLLALSKHVCFIDPELETKTLPIGGDCDTNRRRWRVVRALRVALHVTGFAREGGCD